MANIQILKDKDETIHLLIENYGVIDYLADSELNKNNVNIRVINNNYGKVIIAASGTNRVVQIALEHKELIKKDEYVDFRFVETVYKERLISVLRNEYWGKLEDDKGELDLKAAYYIIANGKIFHLFGDGPVEEGTYITNQDALMRFNHIMYGNYDTHGESYLLKLNEMYETFSHDTKTPVYYINNKDFKVKKERG